jgi:hypothetical protein
MKYCYVLASTTWDKYARMVYLSASSLRRVHPDAEIVLVADEASAHMASQPCYPLQEILTRVVRVPDVKGTDSSIRSRFLKTSIRRWLEGDFLFIDADTLLVRPVHPVIGATKSLAAVRDCEDPRTPGGVPDRIKQIYGQLGWRLPAATYFNTGIVFYPDKRETREFCTEWHRRWHLSLQVGIYFDQPAFNSAATDLGIKISELDRSLNAYVTVDPRFARGARILHFCVTADSFKQTVLQYLLNSLKPPRWSVDWTPLERCSRQQHPWAPPYQPDTLWSSGNYNRAVLAALTCPKKAASSVLRRSIRFVRNAAVRFQREHHQ